MTGATASSSSDGGRGRLGLAAQITRTVRATRWMLAEAVLPTYGGHPALTTRTPHRQET